MWIRLACVWLVLWSSAVWGMDDVPVSVSRAVNRAVELLEAGRIDDALKHLETAAQKGGTHYLIDFAMGNCHMQAERYESAGDAYRRAVKKSPAYAPAWFNWAKSRYELGDYSPAGEMFLKAYELSEKKDPNTLYYAVISLMRSDMAKRALPLIERLLADHAGDIQPEWEIAQVHILLELGKNPEALPIIAHLAQTLDPPQNRQWRETLLYQYMSLGMNEKALSYAETLIREEPMEPKWWKGLAHLNLSLDRREKALVALTIYCHLTAPTREEKRLLADLSAAVDIPAGSVEILKDLLSEKWETDVVIALARNYLSLHQSKTALAWLERGLSKDSDDPDLLMLKGNVLFSQKNYSDAAEVFRELTRIDGESGRGWLMLGYAAWHMDDVATAVKAMEQARKDPNQRRQAEEALKRLAPS